MKKNYFYLILILFLGVSHFSISQSPGNTLDFDGVDDYVTAPLPAVFNDIANNEFTIEVWVKPEGNAFSRVVFAQTSSSVFTSLSLSTTNQIYFYVNNSVAEVTDATLPQGVWSHVACTWLGSSSEALVYINGILETTSGGGTSTTGIDNTLTIGSRTDGFQFFDGELDEVRIWDVKRTSCEIQGSYNSEFTAAQSNLVLYYNFNQGVPAGTNSTITNLSDFTGNHNGTLNSFALTASTSNWVLSSAGINAINQNSNIVTGTDTRTECGPYEWIDGNTYTSDNNSAMFTIVGGAANGCDSIVTLDLTTNQVSDITTSLNGVSITANNSNATSLWLDCDNNFSVISNEVSQTFTPSQNGNYAVQLSENGCVDTSNCVSISTVSLSESDFATKIITYPNPTEGEFSVDLGSFYEKIEVSIKDIHGRLVQESNFYAQQLLTFSIDAPAGVYFLSLDADDQKVIIRFVKK